MKDCGKLCSGDVLFRCSSVITAAEAELWAPSFTEALMNNKKPLAAWELLSLWRLLAPTHTHQEEKHQLQFRHANVVSKHITGLEFLPKTSPTELKQYDKSRVELFSRISKQNSKTISFCEGVIFCQLWWRSFALFCHLIDQTTGWLIEKIISRLISSDGDWVLAVSAALSHPGSL